MKPCLDLTGRTALVTGASSGLGARFAHLLAANGARVVLGARRRDRLEHLRATIEADGGQALAVSLDVADEASVASAYDAAEAAFGPVDTIIANAGGNVEGTGLTLAASAFAQVLAVNVMGVFLTAREGARRMIATNSAETRRGRVLLISSITATAVSPGLTAYMEPDAAIRGERCAHAEAAPSPSKRVGYQCASFD